MPNLIIFVMLGMYCLWFLDFPQIIQLLPEFVATSVCFICFLSIIFNLNQPHFPLSPTPRKDIIIPSGTLKSGKTQSVSQRKYRDFSIMVMKLRSGDVPVNTNFIPHRNSK